MPQAAPLKKNIPKGNSYSFSDFMDYMTRPGAALSMPDSQLEQLINICLGPHHFSLVVQEAGEIVGNDAYGNVRKALVYDFTADKVIGTLIATEKKELTFTNGLLL